MAMTSFVVGDGAGEKLVRWEGLKGVVNRN